MSRSFKKYPVVVQEKDDRKYLNRKIRPLGLIEKYLAGIGNIFGLKRMQLIYGKIHLNFKRNIH